MAGRKKSAVSFAGRENPRIFRRKLKFIQKSEFQPSVINFSKSSAIHPSMADLSLLNFYPNRRIHPVKKFRFQQK